MMLIQTIGSVWTCFISIHSVSLHKLSDVNRQMVPIYKVKKFRQKLNFS